MIPSEGPETYQAVCRLHSEFDRIDSNDPKAIAIGKIAKEFAADVRFAERSVQAQIARNAEALIPESDRGCLPPSALAWLNRYAVVDTLALYYRSRHGLTFIVILAIAFVAMLILEFFAHVLPELSAAGERVRLISLAFPLLWLCGLAIWYFAHSRRFQNKYHDYRALAEGLRVQLFWNILGLDDRIEDHYLHKQQDELEWIRRTIACWREHDRKTLSGDALRTEQMVARKALVCRSWIKGQIKYYRELGWRERKKCHGWKRLGAMLLWSGVVLSGTLGACEIWYGMEPPSESHEGLTLLQSLLVFAVSMFLTGAAVCVAYSEKMGFAEHARQYDVAHNLYCRHDRHLDAGPLNPDEIEHFRTLGKASLQENGDWLLFHRDRPLEIIVP